MSENDKGPETVEDALQWVEQLHEDVAHYDWATAADESLPQVIKFVQDQTDVPIKSMGNVNNDSQNND